MTYMTVIKGIYMMVGWFFLLMLATCPEARTVPAMVLLSSAVLGIILYIFRSHLVAILKWVGISLLILLGIAILVVICFDSAPLGLTGAIILAAFIIAASNSNKCCHHD
jgi:hypothetical protein